MKRHCLTLRLSFFFVSVMRVQCTLHIAHHHARMIHLLSLWICTLNNYKHILNRFVLLWFVTHTIPMSLCQAFLPSRNHVLHAFNQDRGNYVAWKSVTHWWWRHCIASTIECHQIAWHQIAPWILFGMTNASFFLALLGISISFAQPSTFSLGLSLCVCVLLLVGECDRVATLIHYNHFNILRNGSISIVFPQNIAFSGCVAINYLIPFDQMTNNFLWASIENRKQIGNMIRNGCSIFHRNAE